MAQICSCGTELPDNARFCHHCGKPQREEDLPQHAPEPPAGALAAAGPFAIGFGNPMAVRTAILWGSLGALLRAIPIVNLGCCLWLTGTGFGSVYSYSRRAKVGLSAGQGARLGSMTGLIGFVLNLIFDALNFALLRASGRNIAEAMREAMEKLPFQDESARQMMERVFSSPGLLALVVLISVVMTFVLTLSLTAAGGALGAKVLEKE